MYYLPLRHDAVATNLLKIIIKKNHALKIDNHKYWSKILIKIITKVTHNKLDLLLWENEQKICQVIEFSCPCDVTLINKTAEEINTYGPLIYNLQISYSLYQFEIIPIVIGALGYVAKSLVYVKQLGFEDKDTIFVIRKLQILASSGI